MKIQELRDSLYLRGHMISFIQDSLHEPSSGSLSMGGSLPLPNMPTLSQPTESWIYKPLQVSVSTTDGNKTSPFASSFVESQFNWLNIAYGRPTDPALPS